MVTDYTNDTTRPVLEDYNVDLTNDTITLTFSEIVLTSNINIGGITLLNTANLSDPGLLYFTLETSFSQSLPGPQIILSLSREDSIAIKSIPGLLSDINTTFIMISSMAFDDAAGNVLIPLESLPTQSYTSDSIPPELLCYTFDFNTDHLILTFNEPVSTDTFDISQLLSCN